MLQRLPFRKGQGVARVCQRFSLPASDRSRYVSINCWRSIPRRCATRSTSSSLKLGFISRQQLPQVVQSIPAHTRRVVSKTRWSISPGSRPHPVFRNWRNLEFSSSFLPASSRIWTRSRAIRSSKFRCARHYGCPGGAFWSSRYLLAQPKIRRDLPSSQEDGFLRGRVPGGFSPPARRGRVCKPNTPEAFGTLRGEPEFPQEQSAHPIWHSGRPTEGCLHWSHAGC